MKTKKHKVALLLLIMTLAVTALVVSTRDLPAGEQDDCLAPDDCGPRDPQVKCSNGVVYPNICAAMEDCQDDCQAAGGGTL